MGLSVPVVAHLVDKRVELGLRGRQVHAGLVLLNVADSAEGCNELCHLLDDLKRLVAGLSQVFYDCSVSLSSILGLCLMRNYIMLSDRTPSDASEQCLEAHVTGQMVGG